MPQSQNNKSYYKSSSCKNRMEQKLAGQYLIALQKEYQIRDSYRYDSKTLSDRGLARARQICRLFCVDKKIDDARFHTFFYLLPKSLQIRLLLFRRKLAIFNTHPKRTVTSTFERYSKLKTLEIGCGDGMTSYYLKDNGFDSYCCDINPARLDKRAKNSVQFHTYSAEKLGYNDNYFDLVFSYNSFEHFLNPEQVLSEMSRITKTNGYIYLDFGPLYESPWGLHAYRHITVPYCQFLFSEYDMNNCLKKDKLSDLIHVNKWSIEQFRALWNKFQDELALLHYKEDLDYEGLDIIKTHPQFFTKKLENYLIHSISILFRKK